MGSQADQAENQRKQVRSDISKWVKCFSNEY